MAVALDTKRSQSKVIHVDWDGDDVEVAYLPNAVTPKLLEDVDEASKRDDLSVLGTMLEPIIEWWDVLEHDGGPRIGTDAQTIAGLPMRWLTLVQKAIQDDQDPQGSEERGGSLVG